MKRRVAVLLVLLPVLVLGTTIAHVLLIPVTVPTSYDDFRAQLERQMPGLMREQRVPGVAVALVHQGAVSWMHGYGLADIARDVPVGAETMFQAGSISKSVTAWGVMRLVEDGRLDLDSPVSKYLMRWQLPSSAFDVTGVTVRRLLSHTAGLSVGGYMGYDPAAPLPSLVTELNVGADAAEPDGSVHVAYPPGDEYQYSGGGYAVLQLLVEEVSGESFPTYMQRHVLTPLGMTHSTFEWSPASQATTASPYATDGVALPQYQFPAKAAAGLYTTASDIATFAADSMQVPAGPARGRAVIAPASVDLMLSPSPHVMTFAPEKRHPLLGPSPENFGSFKARRTSLLANPRVHSPQRKKLSRKAGARRPVGGKRCDMLLGASAGSYRYASCFSAAPRRRAQCRPARPSPSRGSTLYDMNRSQAA
jgi:CubicO group peptidase (beta-lactamase class C family)